MHRINALALIAATAFVAGCSSVQEPTVLGTRQPVTLGTRGDDAHRETYRLRLAGNRRDMSVIVSTERKETRADLGLRLVEVTKSLALERGLQPYQGLLVESVDEDGPASKAGVFPGDLVLEVDGNALQYRETLDHFLRTQTEPGAELKLRLMRGRAAMSAIDVAVQVGSREVTVPSKKAVPLAPPAKRKVRYSGMVTGTLDATSAEAIYGDARPTVLVGGVYLGSPAYHAGIRSGDRIVSVDGRHYESAEELDAFFAEAGGRGMDVEIVVERTATGRYASTLALDRFDTRTDVLVPLVFGLDSSASETEWTFGPFGIVACYSGKELRADTRAPNYRRKFSMLAGLFRHKWTPESSRTRLLWLISWRSR